MGLSLGAGESPAMTKERALSNKTENRKLFCKLTQGELITKGEEIVALYKKNAELDMSKKRLSAAIKRNDEDIEKLLGHVDTKQEEREVECMWVFFWHDGTKKLVRLDSYTVVEATTIKEWERQGKLDDVEDEPPTELEAQAREAAERDDSEAAPEPLWDETEGQEATDASSN